MHIDYIHCAWGAMAAPSEKRTQEYGAIIEHIGRERNLDFSGWRPGCLLRRIDHRIRASGAESAAEYLKLLKNTPGEIDRLLDSIAINVTEFFRNPDVFEALRTSVVPRVVEDALSKGYPRIRVWGAGAANGAEAYTLAILFSEEFERIGRQVPLSIQ
ncbi:MAG TPA: CheR family methyltransferase, partial [bacterium]|nr:CheR family methyltransferase [bacterium]